MLRRHRSLALLLACACTSAPEIDALTHEIVSGTPDLGDPATVFLWLGGGSCSGTLVSPKTVLTARHCIDGTTAAQVSVFFGNDAEGAGTWIDATILQGHATTDIAMVAMAEAGPTPWIPLNRATLAEGNLGNPVRIVGFGVTGENATDSGLKRQGMTTLHELDGDVMYIGNSGSKTCYGDSGGPAFMTFAGVEHVAGVTSFGTSVCEAGLSGEIRVDPYVDWIQTFIDTNDPATCEADARCVTAGCAAPDPDCGAPDPGTDPEPDPGTDPGTDPGSEQPGGEDPDGTGDPGAGGADPGEPEAEGDLVGGCSAGTRSGDGLSALFLLALAALLRRRL